MEVEQRVKELLDRGNGWIKSEEREQIIDELSTLCADDPSLLTSAFSHWSGNLQSVAASALIKIGNRAFELVLTCLQKRVGSAWIVIPTLIKIDAERAINPIIDVILATDKWSEIAASNLGQISEMFVSALIAALDRGNEQAKAYIINILGRVNNPDVTDVLLRYLSQPKLQLVSLNATVRLGVDVFPDVIRVFIETQDLHVRTAMRWVLIHFGKSSIPFFTHALTYTDRSIQIEGVRGLGYIGHASVVELLIKMLNHEDKDIRLEAMLALGRTGDFRAVKPLTKALDASDEDIRLSAAKALEWRRDDNLVNPLVRAMFRTDVDHYMTVQFLGYARDERAVEVLEWFSTQQYAHHWQNPKWAIQTALARIKGQRSVQNFVASVSPEQLKSTSAIQRARAVKKLGSTGNKEAIAPLRIILRDPSKKVRLEACYALSRLGVENNAALSNEHELPFSELDDDVIQWFATFEDINLERKLNYLQSKTQLTASEQSELESLNLTKTASLLRKKRAQEEVTRRGL